MMKVVGDKRLSRCLDQCDGVSICVPTPLRKTGDPADLSHHFSQ